MKRTSTKCGDCQNELHNVCVRRLVGRNLQVGCPGRKEDGSKCKNKFDAILVNTLEFATPVTADDNQVVELRPIQVNPSQDIKNVELLRTQSRASSSSRPTSRAQRKASQRESSVEQED